jgi:hypothetical protein
VSTFRYSRKSQHIKPYQRDAIFHEKRFGVVEGTTKCGKTYCCLVWIFERFMLGKMGWNFWWVAPSVSQAKIAYRRLRRAINRLPALTRAFFKFNDTELTCTGPNGQVLRFLTGEKPDLLYGDDVHDAVVDEYTRLRKEAWFALFSTITKTAGRLRLIGNVKGRKNWGYELARNAETEARDPASKWHYAKITADDAMREGVIKPESVEDARRNLPPEEFRQLFYAEPAENRACPFPLDAIKDCTAPLSSADPVAWGWDLAKSLDFTVGHGLDEEGYTCRFYEWQKPWEECESDILKLTDGVPAMVDESGVGNPIVERLQRQGDNFEGFNFSGTSRNMHGFGKQQLMEFLRAHLMSRAIHFPPEVAQQLMEFEYEYTRHGVRYSAPDGQHDDRVIALALAALKWDALGYGAVSRQAGRVPERPDAEALKAAMKEELALRAEAIKEAQRMIRA